MSRNLRRFLRDPASVAGLVIWTCLALVAIFAPLLAPYDYSLTFGKPLELPSARFLLGTDEIGRDILSRLLVGSRISMSVGLISTGIAMTLGTFLGLVSGFYGGWLDTVIMRFVDGLMAFPGLILILAAVAVLGPNLSNAMIVIGFVSLTGFARLVRANVMATRQLEYVEAARALGAGDGRILLKTILPNILSPLTVRTTLTFAAAVLTEAGLSFLGLGAQPPTPSWGAMLSKGRGFLPLNPYYAIAAGGAVFLTVLSLNLIGDGIRDAFDPRRTRS
jgi:peptide/nickel transport system permease protein